MSEKIDDGNFHMWSPSQFWGDQICFLTIGKRLAKGKDIIIHTGKEAYYWQVGDSPYGFNWQTMSHEILRFWTSFNFVKGIIFDISQRAPIEDQCNGMRCDAMGNLYDTRYVHDVKEVITETYANPLLSYDNYNIAEDIDFNLLQKFDFFIRDIGFQNHLPKIAIFHPISTLHKSQERIDNEMPPWNKSIESLIDKGYEIFAVGSMENREDVDKYYPGLMEKYPINNLMGGTTMFELIDLIMNYASFVLSCDTCSAWYGIASRKKTAIAAGRAMFTGGNNDDPLYGEARFKNSFGNEDVYKKAWADEGELCDSELADWINNNA